MESETRQRITAMILQLLGALTVSVGVGLVFLPAAVIIIGIFLVLFGLAMEKE